MGTRNGNVIPAFTDWDHPHACGDKYKKVFGRDDIKGSSPRVWGQVNCNTNRASASRIIPTRVGTSRLYDTFAMFDEDHPHACGDKYDYCYKDTDYPGSSPRVWGQVLNMYLMFYNIGIIPTRVGTSIGVLYDRWAVGDHPHACGDKNFPLLLELHGKGSSPRVWGQVSMPYIDKNLPRIIPTRVGTSANICGYENKA